jgi:hypothetical protein
VSIVFQLLGANSTLLFPRCAGTTPREDTLGPGMKKLTIVFATSHTSYQSVGVVVTNRSLPWDFPDCGLIPVLIIPWKRKKPLSRH